MSEQLSDRGGWRGFVDAAEGVRARRGCEAGRGSGGAAVRRDRRGDTSKAGLSLSGVAKMLERAFATKNAKAVALVINSPGGSPVQSRQIFLRIRQLAAEKKLPVLVFVEDVAASGGYMIACAGDEIFCDPSSILGSIGVVGGSFGFQDLIKRIGVERRLYTAGSHKAMLDPFLPENPDDVARLKALQREIHAIFIALVKGSRGGRLKGEDDVLFTGEYWAGETSVIAGPGRCDRRSPLDAPRPLWRQGGDAGDHAGKRDAGRPVGPEVAGRRLARRSGRDRGAAGRIDFRAGDPGDLGQIRVLRGGRPRHLAPKGQLRGGPACARIGCIGGRTDVNDKDRPMPPLIAFAGALGSLAVVRWAYKTALRVNRELEEARMARVAEAARAGDIQTLRRDPVTGAYRPG